MNQPNQYDRARELICNVAKDGDKAWTMSVPVQDSDSDQLLLAVIDRAEGTEKRNGELERQKAEMQAEIDALQQECDTLATVRTEAEVARDAQLLALEIRDGHLDTRFKAAFIGPLAAAAARVFELEGGPNYISMEMHEAGRPAYEITIRPITGKRPAELVTELRAALEQSQAECAQIKAHCAQLESAR